MKQKKIIIVGAGLAGLTAAHYLVKNQKVKNKITVFEKDKRIGGRTKLIPFERVELDSSAQFIFGNFSNIIDLFKEYELWGNANRIPLEKFSLYKNGSLHKISVSGLAKYTTAKNKIELVKLLKIIYENKKKLKFTNAETTQELDTEYFSEWAEKRFSKNFFEYLLQPICASLSLSDPHRISAAFGLSLVNATITEGVWGIEGGIGILGKHIERRLTENGVKIEKNREVSRILVKNKKITGVELKGGKIVPADIVISTIPLTGFRKICPKKTEILKICEQVKYAASVHAWFTFKTELLKKTATLFPRVEWPDHMAILESSIKSETHTKDIKTLIETFAFEKHAINLLKKSDKQITKKMTNDLQKIFKTRIKPDKYRIERYLNAIPIHCKNYNRIAKDIQRNREIKGLILAGDFVAMPCTETAVWSGKKAAETIENEILNKRG